jgi:toxin ParE1/3/4
MESSNQVVRESMDKEPRISHEAIRDLNKIWDYIVEDNEIAADNFIDSLVEKCRKLARLEGVGHRREDLVPGLLSLPYKNYVIFFQRNQYMNIVRILHGSRDVQSVFENQL